MTEPYVLALETIGEAQVALAGGKGAHLAELSRIEGMRVPPGFCVTTAAFKRVLATTPWIGDQVERLSRLDPDDHDAIMTIGAKIRRGIEETLLPDDVAAAVSGAAARLGARAAAFAVRSSATAEDTPTASFAGQHDTYLNVVGVAAVPRHVRRCWASLFSERAVSYRLRNGVDHRRVHMAVVVQQMVVPQASGILFTADPVTSNRKVARVEAGFGLGEALVAGLADPDVYQVRDGEVVARTVAVKRLAVQASPAGGTRETAVEPERRGEPALDDAQVVQLARLGRRIEDHFGRPQDIEWCLADGDFHIVQSRPITTLFPIPEAGDRDDHVYISVGHGQMMTDAMKPLGLSLWKLTTPRPMVDAGGRLFVDVRADLASPARRMALVQAFLRSDPLTGDALRTVAERVDVSPALPDGDPPTSPAGDAQAPMDPDPAIVEELITATRHSLATLKRDISGKSGVALLDFILADIHELRRILFDPRSHRVFMTAMEAAWWLNEHLEAWLGEKNAADVLTQSVPDNITSEMGLALLDVADVIRTHADVVTFLEHVDLEHVGGEAFLDELATHDGGPEARAAIGDWLDRYGMRCIGEIDITKPRWTERPAMLVPLILGNVRNFEPGAAERRFAQGLREAERREAELLGRLRALPDGEQKACETQRRIRLLRTFIGYREYPKYGMVSRYFVYKQALLDEAERLVQGGVLRENDDLFFLTLQELHDVVRTGHADPRLIRRRREEFRSFEPLTPPRVITSDGEVVTGSYGRADVPAGALAGLPVSAGTVEGRARVIVDIAEADLDAGDILVTPYTDPSWTPAFVAITGLVTEVGGLMTHGAVIAREYGLPAVVGVEQATRRIRDGQRIRVHGTEGYVEILT